MSTTVTTPQSVTSWPIPKVGTGPALSRRQFATRIGRKLSALEAAERRTKRGDAIRVPFPKPDGYAIDPDSGRDVMVPYWYERKAIAYGKALGALDKRGEI